MVDLSKNNTHATLSLNELAREIHEDAKAHGWWDKPRSFSDIFLLFHNEISEVVEEFRAQKPMLYFGEDGKPEGVAVEVVDAMIRMLDWIGYEGIDIDYIVRLKMNYNKTRPYRHGGKVI